MSPGNSADTVGHMKDDDYDNNNNNVNSESNQKTKSTGYLNRLKKWLLVVLVKHLSPHQLARIH